MKLFLHAVGLQSILADVAHMRAGSRSSNETLAQPGEVPVEVRALTSSADLLTITSIECVRTASGFDDAGKAGAAAVGGFIAAGATIIAGGKVVLATGGTAAVGVIPVTYKAIASAAISGGVVAVSAVDFLDKKWGSGTDQFVLKVNGAQVVPSNGKYQSIRAGQELKLNAQVHFKGNARVDFLEYDWGSDNDYMGKIDIPALDYTSSSPAIMVSETEGSIYLIKYKVEVGKGDPKKVVNYMLCGTNQCDACAHANCARQDSSNIDRDKDYGDLKNCPTGFKHHRYERYPQWWPAADVFLRVCERENNCGSARSSGLRTWGGNGGNRACVFPFKWSTQCYDHCTRAGWENAWCAVQVSPMKWGNCRLPTCGGTAGGAFCQSPFTWKGKTYTSCTSAGHNQPWCYTENGGHRWGNCNCGRRLEDVIV